MGKQAGRQVGRQAGRQAGKKAGWYIGRKTGRQAGKKAGRMVCWQAGSAHMTILVTTTSNVNKQTNMGLLSAPAEIYIHPMGPPWPILKSRIVNILKPMIN